MSLLTTLFVTFYQPRYRQLQGLKTSLDVHEELQLQKGPGISMCT